jgi:hypothetical protein
LYSDYFFNKKREKQNRSSRSNALIKPLKAFGE